MYAQPSLKKQARRSERIYHLSVTALGGGLLLASAFYFPLNTLHLEQGLLLLLLVAFLEIIPVQVLQGELSLAYIPILAGGLLFGPLTAAWAATLGIFLGSAIPRIWPVRWLRKSNFGQSFPAAHDWLNAGFTMGLHNVATLLALGAFGWGAGILGNPALVDQVWRYAPGPMLLFAGLHAAQLAGDYLTRREKNHSPGKKELLSLGLFEIVPLPFILIALSGMGGFWLGPLISVGGLSILFAILMLRMGNVRMYLERHLQELSTLNQISQVLRSTLELDNLLTVLEQQVSQFLAVDNFYVALYHPEDEQIWYPLAVKAGQKVFWPPRPLTDRLTDRVIREGLPILLPHHAQEALPGIGLPPSEDAPAAWMGVPLVSSERTIGCLAVFSHSPEVEFRKTDLNLLVTLSGQTSVAIENALLYDQAQRRAAQLETLNQITTLISASLNPEEVLAQVCRSVTQVGGAKRSAIYLLDMDEGNVWLAHAYELSEAFVGRNQAFTIAHDGRTRCLRTGRPSLVPELRLAHLERNFIESLEQEGVQAFGDFPLVTPDGQIGYLSVYFDARHAFRAEEVELLQTFAAQAALAVSNARLHARTDLALSRRVHQLSILEAVGRELSAAIHSDQLFGMILDYAMEFTNSPWGSISLFDPDSRMLTIRAFRGYLGELVYFSVDEGIGGRAVRTRHTLNVPDVRQDTDYIDRTGGEARSQLSVPLIHEARVLGVLILESPRLNAFAASDQTFIEQLTVQAAVALVNAELYNEIQRRLREQSTLYLVSTQLVGNLELNSILETVGRALQAALATPVLGIYLWDESEETYRLTPLSGPLKELSQQLPPVIQDQDLTSAHNALLDTKPLQISAKKARLRALFAGSDENQILIFPLVVNKQRLGMVVLYLPGKPGVQEDELQLLQAITAQGAISLQNALLFLDVSHGRERLAAVLNSVGEGIMMMDASGRITLANESLQNILNLPLSTFIGVRFPDLPTPILSTYFGYSFREAQALVDVLGEGEVPASPKATLKISDTTPERVLERSSAPVWGRGSRAIGWMIVLREVTEEHQIAQARELITETLVHDLRSPVSAVLGALDVIEEVMEKGKPAEGEISSQAVHVARRGAQRVLGLIESLLDISRLQTGKLDATLTQINPRAMVASVISEFVPMSQELGIILRNEIPADIPQVRADMGKITRVLTNLVDNALKFTPAGGQITISASPTSHEMILIQVSDTGPGVPEEFREKIFERFGQVPGQRSRRRGSGLGLTFCRLAVEAHGGRIWVETRQGGGSIFAFTLPIAGPSTG